MRVPFASIGVDFDNDWEVTSHPVRYLLATLYSVNLFTDEIHLFLTL